MKVGLSRFMVCICVLTICLLATTAHADVTYTFTGVNDGFSGDGKSVAFTYTSSTFLPLTTWVYLSQLSFCQNCAQNGPVLSVTPTNILGTPASGFQFNEDVTGLGILSRGFYYAFALDAFSTPGIYNSIGQNIGYSHGTLTVELVNVPEPSSLAMVLSGGLMLGLICLFRRKAETVAQQLA